MDLISFHLISNFHLISKWTSIYGGFLKWYPNSWMVNGKSKNKYKLNGWWLGVGVHDLGHLHWWQVCLLKWPLQKAFVGSSWHDFCRSDRCSQSEIVEWWILEWTRFGWFINYLSMFYVNKNHLCFRINTHPKMDFMIYLSMFWSNGISGWSLARFTRHSPSLCHLLSIIKKEFLNWGYKSEPKSFKIGYYQWGNQWFGVAIF